MRKARRGLLTALTALAVVAGGLTSVTVTAEPATAAPTVGFVAGNIVDDALFYDGNGMTASEVQKFLNQKVPRCQLGDPGKEVGKKVSWAGKTTKLDSKCLRDKTFNTKTVAADGNCRAYAGKKNETAAQVIVKAAKACSINPKVLLITLEKEQSLVTDAWPNELQYERAAGYKCPDTAPCDSGSAGFYRQIVGAAWQLQHYKNNPQYFNYRKGDKVPIAYNPKSSCKSKTVTIKNHATAGLYIYTPYQPNAAALKTEWGGGDSCSSYGNRNFYNFWKSWFGSVRANLTVSGTIKTYWDKAKAAGTSFGDPVSPRETITANGGGYEMKFTNGVITYSKLTGKTYGVQNSTEHASDTWADDYLESGGAAGPWGFIASEEDGPSYRAITFQNGTAIARTALLNGIRFIPAPVYEVWKKSGDPSREIKGYPLSSQITAGPYGWPMEDPLIGSTKAASQTFERLTIMATGAFSVELTAAEKAEWESFGGYSAIGFYRADAKPIDATAGTWLRHTDKGTLFYLSKKTQWFLRNGAIRTAYLTAKGPSGAWGWPVGDEEKLAGGRTRAFTAGTAVSDEAAGKVRFLTDGAYAHWIKKFSAGSTIGFPTSNTRVLADGEYQLYKKYAIFWGPKTSITLKRDALTKKYLAADGPASVFGWPLLGQSSIRNGMRLKLSNGYVIANTKTGTTALVTTAMYKEWLANGGTKASIGYPIKNTVVLADGSYQRYQKHYVFIGPKKTVLLAKSVATTAYFTGGGPQTSGWGWPTAAQKFAKDGSSTIKFSKGTLTVSKTGKVKFTKK